MYVMSFDDKCSSINGKIDGWIIPGGRDIDPKNYGQENTDSQVSPQAPLRWAHSSDMWNNLDKDIPILGVCFGIQVINCLQGGDLVQHIPTAHNHYRKRRMEEES